MVFWRISASLSGFDSEIMAALAARNEEKGGAGVGVGVGLGVVE